MQDLDKLLAETKDAGTYLMAGDHVDEGIAVEGLRQELIRLRAQVESGKPVCPHCKTAMAPTNYKGYYDQFPCWICECRELPNAESMVGDCG